MTDEAGHPGDDDRLPWLQAVEEEEEREGPPVAKLVAAVIIGLVAIGVIVGGLFWLRQSGGEEGRGELIAAPEGDYKIKPADPGGMDVEGAGDTVYAASEGAEPSARLASRGTEAPVTATDTPRPAPSPSPSPAQPRPSTVEPQAPAAPPATIQLGAFSTQARANRAWEALSGRFRYLAPLSHSVIPVQSGDRTLYRLRASGADAAGICRRLEIAGEDCAIVD